MAVEKAFDVERTPVPGILAGVAGVLSPAPARGVMSPFGKRGAAAVTAVVLIGGCAAASAQDDGPAVLPYRPSVASPADLPAQGWPELEVGLQWTKGGDTARSKTAPMTFKLAWTESWAMLIGTDAYAWQRADDGSTAQGVGDTSLTLKIQTPHRSCPGCKALPEPSAATPRPIARDVHLPISRVKPGGVFCQG